MGTGLWRSDQKHNAYDFEGIVFREHNSFILPLDMAPFAVQFLPLYRLLSSLS